MSERFLPASQAENLHRIHGNIPSGIVTMGLGCRRSQANFIGIGGIVIRIIPRIQTLRHDGHEAFHIFIVAIIRFCGLTFLHYPEARYGEGVCRVSEVPKNASLLDGELDVVTTRCRDLRAVSLVD